MRAIIVGGGKVGRFILKTLKVGKSEVSLIERDQDVCNRIAEEMDAVILCGDGTDPDVLMDADVDAADMVIAVTGRDEENLVICQIAKLQFGVPKTIARINNPKNNRLFTELGVDRTVCSTEVIANLIQWELEEREVNIVQAIDGGGIVLAEASVGEKNVWVDHDIGSIPLPEGCQIVSLIRGDRVVTPMVGEKLAKGDKLLMVANVQLKADVEQVLFEGGRHGH